MRAVPIGPDDSHSPDNTASDTMLRDLQDLAGQLFLLKETMLDQIKVVEVMARAVPCAGDTNPAATTPPMSVPPVAQCACGKEVHACEYAPGSNETDAYYLID